MSGGPWNKKQCLTKRQIVLALIKDAGPAGISGKEIGDIFRRKFEKRHIVVSQCLFPEDPVYESEGPNVRYFWCGKEWWEATV